MATEKELLTYLADKCYWKGDKLCFLGKSDEIPYEFIVFFQNTSRTSLSEIIAGMEDENKQFYKKSYDYGAGLVYNKMDNPYKVKLYAVDGCFSYCISREEFLNFLKHLMKKHSADNSVLQYIYYTIVEFCKWISMPYQDDSSLV